MSLVCCLGSHYICAFRVKLHAKIKQCCLVIYVICHKIYIHTKKIYIIRTHHMFIRGFCNVHVYYNVQISIMWLVCFYFLYIYQSL